MRPFLAYRIHKNIVHILKFQKVSSEYTYFLQTKFLMYYFFILGHISMYKKNLSDDIFEVKEQLQCSLILIYALPKYTYSYVMYQIK